MVNRQQLLAVIAHGALRCKQIFGCGFVSDERIGGDIPQWIDGLCARLIAADQAAAFVGGSLLGVRDDLVDVPDKDSEHYRSAILNPNCFASASLPQPANP
jgi:hypothetical protein